MRQTEQGIPIIGSISDAQHSRARGMAEHVGTVSDTTQRGQNASVEQAARGGRDTVKLSEEARQAILGRTFSETHEVSALKDTLRGMMHERPNGRFSDRPPPQE